MDIKIVWEEFLGMIRLENTAYTKAAKKPFSNSLVNFALGGIAIGLGAFWLTLGFSDLLGGAITAFVGLTLAYFIFVGILWILAKLFGGKAGFMEQYNASSYLALWNVLYVIPFIGPFLAALGNLWGVVMSVVLVRSVHKISTGAAVAVVLIPVFLAFILAFVMIAALISFLVASGLMPMLDMPQ